MTQATRHRLFVLHSPAEAEWISGVLLPRLGLSVAEVLTFRDFTPGQPVLNELERAIASSDVSLALLTADFLRDPLSQMAEELVVYLAYMEGQGRFVALRLDNAEIPAYLRSRVVLDARDASRLQEELGRLATLLGQAQPAREPVPCPYPGMVPFSRADEARFFGREEEVSGIAKRLQAGANLLLVIGPSGSGKSSLVSAGLAPRLQAAGWSVQEMRPAAATTFDLAEALGKMPAEVRWLWSVDQFEGVFSSLART